MMLVSGDGKLAKALVDLSNNDLQITKLPKKVMDITDEYEVSEVIKQYMTQPNYPKYFVHTAALTKPMNINDRNPIMSLSTNIVGTANVAKICHKNQHQTLFLLFPIYLYCRNSYQLMNLDDKQKTYMSHRALVIILYQIILTHFFLTNF